MQTYSYTPQVQPGPTGTITAFISAESSQLTEIGDYDGRRIVIAPDGELPPAQPAAIDWRQEQPDTDPALATWISQTRYSTLVEAARARKHNARDAARVSAETGGFTYAGHLVASDERSIARIGNAATAALTANAAGQPFSVDWLCADETVLALDAAGMLALQSALVAHGQACHDASQAIKAQINAAETLAELSAIDVTAGYPA
ncbi:MAG: DUF4376 domain-containing protein [Lamprobacter sp.]|uniref:DUF4376 domain-containing protein n=1 Tax=Lamprobacter sp. TaxID=3100796 RepID=UPI002B261478|nr:DUF4376 domain-containing protein [Lamprobacter sp.]MEA3641877.1 DUF4376 domain-containing protein [Lamprobacter sp.]